MKRVLVPLLAIIIGLGATMHDAEAKRLGGGKSFGMQRGDSVIRRDASPTPQVPRQNAAGQNQLAQQPGMAGAQTMPQKRSWLGPIAGLAAGLGLAALASHFGFGEGLASILMIALLAMAAVFVFKLLLGRKKAEPQGAGMQYAGMGSGGAANERPVYTGPVPATADSPAAGAPATGSIPADFDVEGFVRQAKLNFIRLQAANDAGNLDDIREFTSPELFAEIKMQLDERGGVVQRTDIVNLNAQVLDVTTEPNRHIVSVRFYGALREDGENAPPTTFDEVWHLTKPISGDRGWMVAGIEQRQ